MEWTAILVMLADTNPLGFDAAQAWCDRHIPAKDITFINNLVPALCLALKMDECDLRIRVQEEFLNTKSFCHTTVQ